ncbi:protein adenylyltransferase SelO [Sandaracinus amylolyticus]|uniref:protein adenylyltransferase SelO n=1 Tax=Sandaracinus amylolyticus TaxID=927083 RepID=UPI00069CE364
MQLDDRFVRELPGDLDGAPRPRQVRGAAWSKVLPTPVAKPRLMVAVPEVAALLDLTTTELESPEMVEVLAGNRVLPGMQPYAACYGGHQFGHWAGQLGDGRAITLGEVINTRGERWEMQLKGAGRTPYSRTADGRAVMRSSVRELVCSEAMFHLGVPTTRALSLVATGEDVVRDVMYSGDPRPEPGAIVCRVAPSFLRFGNFEIFASRDEIDLLRALADHTIRAHFAHLGAPSRETYGAWLAEVCRRTAEMVMHWMRVGFVHGVMNTDNMSILGLTIDYGPYGWLEGYDPSWTPNTTDAGGRRYRYGHQPNVAWWNLQRLARALVPLVGDDVAILERALMTYGETLEAREAEMIAKKLGLRALDVGPAGDDVPMVQELYELLEAFETDMTIFFRRLADVPSDPGDVTDAALIAPLEDAFYGEPPEDHRHRVATWLRRYAERVRADGTNDVERRAKMNAVNPKYVCRNYLAQLAIDDAEKGDPGKVLALLDVLRRPYDDQPGKDEYAMKRPEWARHRVGCSMLSCSS